MMTEEFRGLADFEVVYIAEAHPKDGWAFQGNIEVDTHRSLEERQAAAGRMVELEPQLCEVLVDQLDDRASRHYAAFPERLYIVQDGVVLYQGGRGPFGYKLEEVDDFLRKYERQ
ncbi:type I iodothyronine deiodinase-like [Panulirus ornatus]|uniref:type I iodothyronine deiodinase-like n=1 Tax=Panulirus ornatus TaxID=150431 RepID=UPI003A896E1C